MCRIDDLIFFCNVHLTLCRDQRFLIMRRTGRAMILDLVSNLSILAPISASSWTDGDVGLVPPPAIPIQKKMPGNPPVRSYQVSFHPLM
jgi:hypothetical protein